MRSEIIVLPNVRSPPPKADISSILDLCVFDLTFRWIGLPFGHGAFGLDPFNLNAKPKPPTKAKGYKGVTAGSRKETVRKVFDQNGRDAAIEKALALELKESTAKSWIGAWKREDAATSKAA